MARQLQLCHNRPTGKAVVSLHMCPSALPARWKRVAVVLPAMQGILLQAGTQAMKQEQQAIPSMVCGFMDLDTRARMAIQLVLQGWCPVVFLRDHWPGVTVMIEQEGRIEDGE